MSPASRGDSTQGTEMMCVRPHVSQAQPARDARNEE